MKTYFDINTAFERGEISEEKAGMLFDLCDLREENEKLKKENERLKEILSETA